MGRPHNMAATLTYVVSAAALLFLLASVAGWLP